MKFTALAVATPERTIDHLLWPAPSVFVGVEPECDCAGSPAFDDRLERLDFPVGLVRVVLMLTLRGSREGGPSELRRCFPGMLPRLILPGWDECSGFVNSVECRLLSLAALRALPSLTPVLTIDHRLALELLRDLCDPGTNGSSPAKEFRTCALNTARFSFSNANEARTSALNLARFSFSSTLSPLKIRQDLQ